MTVTTYHHVCKIKKCPLVLAGGLSTNDPEGEKLLANINSMVKDDEDIHILCLPLENRLENYIEVNALQRRPQINKLTLF